MMIKFEARVNEFNNEVEVRAVFGFTHLVPPRKGDGDELVEHTEECATVYREQRFSSKEMRVTTNWSAWGSRDVATADQFASALTQAVEFAKLLEEGCFSNAALLELGAEFERKRRAAIAACDMAHTV